MRIVEARMFDAKRTAFWKPYQKKETLHFRGLAQFDDARHAGFVGGTKENNLVFHLHKNINIERLRK